MSAQQLPEQLIKVISVLVHHRNIRIQPPPEVLIGGGAQHGPGGGGGMQHQQLAHGPPFGQHGADSGEVILHNPVIFPPGGLVIEYRGIIPLPAALQGIQRQMLGAHVDAKHILPVPHPFLSLKGEVPAGTAVGFGNHEFAPVLVGDAGALFDGQMLLRLLAKHVDTRHLLVAVMGHNGAANPGGHSQRILPQVVSGEGDSVVPAPFPQLSGEGIAELLRDRPPEIMAGQG
ncbi:hypothetical protein D3C75_597570 [compost metagenome]